jgi:NTE family protein
MKKALVLSGGGIKGAFEAGAVAKLLAGGWTPDAIYGISAGAMNGAFLADRCGQAVLTGQNVNWLDIGNQLTQFWTQNITGPSSLLRKKAWWELAIAILFDTFDGLVDSTPIRSLIRQSFTPANIGASTAKLTVGATDLDTGKVVYVGGGDPDIVEYVLASGAEPIAASIVRVQGEPFYDGGLQVMAPIEKAIDDGALEVVCILCDSADLMQGGYSAGSPFSLVGRVVDIVTNAIVNADLEMADVKQKLAASGGPGVTPAIAKFRALSLKTYRPTNQITVPLDSFTPADIAAMIQQGWQTVP